MTLDIEKTLIGTEIRHELEQLRHWMDVSAAQMKNIYDSKKPMADVSDEELKGIFFKAYGCYHLAEKNLDLTKEVVKKNWLK